MKYPQRFTFVMQVHKFKHRDGPFQYGHVLNSQDVSAKD
jgi:hypothetical protein